jgi:alpha-L-fucosidase
MHNPHYPNAGRNYELPAPEAGDEPDEEKYMDFLRTQVRDLCTNYGTIHGFWWDGMMFGRKDPSVNAMIRSLQPAAVINGRGFDEGDFATPERDWDDSVHRLESFAKPTEACQSVGKQSWGYRKNEDFYSNRHLIASIDNALAKGGNYLLNVGPDANGVITEEYRRIVLDIGRWYRSVREAFEGTDTIRINDDHDILVTRRGSTLYVHLAKPPATNTVVLRPLAIPPVRAVVLNTGKNADTRVENLPCHHREKEPDLRVANLPVNENADTVLVIRLDFETLPGQIAPSARADTVA